MNRSFIYLTRFWLKSLHYFLTLSVQSGLRPDIKTKPSWPYGEIAQDAFGRVPVFEDKGNIERAILALGRQDVDGSAIKPKIMADVLGASSDHLILDVSGLGLQVGDEVKFDIGYSALLRAMTSPYVEKVYLSRSHLTARGSSWC
jgi:predicted amino acid racemase